MSNERRALVFAALALQKHMNPSGVEGIASALVVGMSMALNDPKTSRRVVDDCLQETPSIEPASREVMTAIAAYLDRPPGSPPKARP